MKVEQLSKEAIKHCDSIRGKNYSGCGSDYEFCKLCRDVTWSLDALNRRTLKINELALQKS